MAEAVAFLTEKNSKVPQQDETTYYQTSQVASDRYISVGSQADTSKHITSEWDETKIILIAMCANVLRNMKEHQHNVS